MKYDIAIVGAGIPGLYTARELAKIGYKVGLFERLKTQGEPNYSTAWVAPETIDLFDLPKDGIATPVFEYIISDFEKEAKKISTKIQAYVLDFRKTKILLSEQCKLLGVDILYDTNIVDINFDNNLKKYTFIKTADNEEIYSNYFIDASGPSFALYSKVKKEELKEKPAIGLEHIIEDKSGHLQKYKNSIVIYFSSYYSPHGYAWISGNGNNTYKIGLCEADFEPTSKLPTLGERLEIFLDKIVKLDEIRIIETDGSERYVSKDYIDQPNYNLLGVGDSIGAINPLLGEGIRHGLYSAKFLVEEFSELKLKNIDIDRKFNIKWKRYKNNKWWICSIIKNALYKRNDPDQEKFISELIDFIDKNLNSDELLKFGYYYNLWPILSKFPRNIRLIKSFIKAYK